MPAVVGGADATQRSSQARRFTVDGSAGSSDRRLSPGSSGAPWRRFLARRPEEGGRQVTWAASSPVIVAITVSGLAAHSRR
ncbi:hypothetical protein [Nonomuraea dietziae]|uniref:hypothetical protein n=1 Tax=Nonomuraea dietziae TaxID=65515 RepID=UPI0031DCC81A